MQMLRPRPRRAAEAIVMLPVEQITPNPWQPRQNFDPEGLRELADSISRYGVLSPLSVRARGGRYELVAGERRLRAARLAGLREVPCILLDVDSAQSGAIALVENLQRRDLDFVEQAQGMERLIRLFGMSQEECARRLGKSQPSVANKLRLLKLPEDVLAGLTAAGLTERHGRALLRLPGAEEQRKAFAVMAEKEMTVSAADAYVDRLLREREDSPEGRTRLVLKDVRVFLNSLQHSLDVMRRGGVEADISREESAEALVVTIRIRR